MKKIFQALAMLIVLAVAAVLWADGVLVTDMGAAEEVVKARKLLMKTIGANMKDINDKIKGNRIADVAVNAGTIGAMAVVLPPLYKERHEGVYPIEGSKSFYKGGTAVDFERASAQLKTAADTLGAAAEKKNKAGVREGFGMLKSACGACHSTFRGKY